MSEPDPATPNEPVLRFGCGGCGHELEAPPAYAGVEGPCPVCGAVVRAPDLKPARREAPAAEKRAGQRGAGMELHLPPLNETTGVVELPEDFWEEQLEASPPEEEPWMVSGAGEPRREGAAGRIPVAAERSAERVELPVSRLLPVPSREEEEAAAVADERQQEFRLRFFDAALLLFFLGTLVMGGAALAFTQSKRGVGSPVVPALSELVVARMQEQEQRRDLAVEEAKMKVQHWVTASRSASPMEDFSLPGDPRPAAPGTGGGAEAPVDFEFIQARRIPGTERFLTLFELLSDPPLLVPVEETPAGPRLHGRAIAQQQNGSLAKFLASQGQAEASFYVMLRPGPAPMVRDLLKARPDLGNFIHVGVEPAFPADGSLGCLACLQPGSEAAAIFHKRALDPGLRPAVVRLAWRQHRESGNFVELVSFEPNGWSRH